jgi:hypothetical protein
MPSDLPILEPLEGEEKVFDLTDITGKLQRGTCEFTVQDNSKILLNHATDEWCLLKGDRLFLQKNIMRGPLSLPSREISDNFPLSVFNPSVEHQERVWNHFCSDKRA